MHIVSCYNDPYRWLAIYIINLSFDEFFHRSYALFKLMSSTILRNIASGFVHFGFSSIVNAKLTIISSWWFVSDRLSFSSSIFWLSEENRSYVIDFCTNLKVDITSKELIEVFFFAIRHMNLLNDLILQLFHYLILKTSFNLRITQFIRIIQYTTTQLLINIPDYKVLYFQEYIYKIFVQLFVVFKEIVYEGISDVTEIVEC